MYVFVVANYNCFNILISASQLVLVENNIFGAFFLQRDAQINVTFSQRSCILFTLFFQKKKCSLFVCSMMKISEQIS